MKYHRVTTTRSCITNLLQLIEMYDSAKNSINDANRIVIIQPENPDGDSLASALALESILSIQGKEVSLYCAIDMPKYLRFIPGWDRVESDWTGKYDLAIIVDTVAEALLQKALETPGFRSFMETHPVLVIDHHNADEEKNTGDLPFTFTLLHEEEASATSEVIYHLAEQADWKLDASTSELMLSSILADTLGLTTQSTTPETFRVVYELVKNGAQPADIEQRRREYMKKPADILAYKGDLIHRIEYHSDDRLALVHIPWEDIQQYSDRYNPSVLVLDEMRLVEGVDIAIAIKTYPDGKLTGKIRSNLPIADLVAGYFGGGGHSYSAGFKIYENYDTACRELISATEKILQEYHSETS